MNEMDAYNRSGYRDYRNYDDMDNRNYRNYRNYRDDYRDDYRDYDRRGGKINNRDYRNYRNYREDYYEELEMLMEDMREQYRRLEDISEIASNQQDKSMLMKIAEKQKEMMNHIKSLTEK